MPHDVKKVLLVEDDEGLRIIGQMCLEGGSDWQIVVAANGFEALDMLEAENPDLILLDMMMPGMNGLETLAKIREKRPDVYVIFLTAKIQIQEVHKYKVPGVAGVILKPFDPLQLPAEILRILDNEYGKPN